MTGFAATALQQAVFTALTQDPQLSAVVNGNVYDWVPESAQFPYVSIGADTAIDWSGCQFDGQETTLTIHAWTRGTGRAQLKTVMGHIYRVLHNAKLSVAGQQLVLLQSEFADSSLDPDGVTYHGAQRFRALTQGV